MPIREDDGSFLIYHRNRDLEEKMDKQYVRWLNEMRWSPKRNGIPLEVFNNKHPNETAIIIGKGPSLDNLTIADFNQEIVFCCNDSIHHVISLCLNNTLYSVQLDMNLRDTCRSKHAIHFISAWAKDWVPDATVLRTVHTKKLLTAVEAILLARFMGIKKFILYAFDSCVTQDVTYANCIGYQPGKNPERFLNHKKYILEALEGCEYEFRTR